MGDVQEHGGITEDESNEAAVSVEETEKSMSRRAVFAGAAAAVVALAGGAIAYGTMSGNSQGRTGSSSAAAIAESSGGSSAERHRSSSASGSASASAMESMAELSFDVSLKDWDETGSTPLLAHVVGTSKDGADVERYYALADGPSDYEAPLGRYTVDYVQALNKDGSTYEKPDRTSIVLGAGGYTVKVEPKKVEAKKTTGKQLEKIAEKVKELVKSAPEDAFDGKGLEIVATASSIAAAKLAAEGQKSEESKSKEAESTSKPSKSTETDSKASQSAQQSVESGDKGSATSAPAEEPKKPENEESSGSENASAPEEPLTVVVDEDDEEGIDTSRAGKTWIEEAGHYERGDDGKTEWVVDVPGHWE